MKGIILAGGKGTRLYPLTIATNKHLLAVYDKPMIYYPLVTLMRASIKDILIITSREHLKPLQALLGDGSTLGIRLSYRVQKEPRGIADAFILGRRFIGKDSVCLALGDNIFWGEGLGDIVRGAAQQFDSAVKDNVPTALIFGLRAKVEHLVDLGVMFRDASGKVISLDEKPGKETLATTQFDCFAIPGLYFYDRHVVEVVKDVKPSSRGELEITELNKKYLQHGHVLHSMILPNTVSWRDTGTVQALHEVAVVIEHEQAQKRIPIGSPELAAYKQKFITRADVVALAERYTNEYKTLLLRGIERAPQSSNVRKLTSRRARSRSPVVEETARRYQSSRR